MSRTILRAAALALISVALGACSANVRDVHGEPPQVSLGGLQKRDDGVVVELALRNVNDDPLQLVAASIELTLDGKPLANGGRDLPLTVSARGREVLRLALPADPAGLGRLDALASGEAPRLPWTLKARLELADDPDRDTTTEGWLHRVPGQPDRFR